MTRKLSSANLNRIINGEAEGRLFLGHYEWVHWEQCVDRVRFEQ